MDSITNNLIRNALNENRTYLLEPEAKMICIEYGIPVPGFRVAKSESEATSAAKELGFPVVLKIVSQDVIHKSDVGGVVFGPKTIDEVKAAFELIMANVKKNKPDARIDGILVSAMAPSSTEVIVGSIKDPQFGPALMFGLGGIFVELLKDVSFRVAPITENDAMEMITEIKAFPILKGYRNYPAVDLKALSDLLLKVSRLVTEHQEISELDLNPTILYSDGLQVVDARIILTK
ncbi:MAG TPA: acetate--CoA ligase family protein [Candidatus Bathyarchaeia archaeon]|nr:acetate--CoA ligase family protein [Candidatus Bathyarchaeia archaeon]